MHPTQEHLSNIKQILTDLKSEIHINIITVGNFNAPLSSMDKSCRQSQQENRGLKLNIRPGGFDRFVQNISSKCNRIHILLKGICYFLKNKPYFGTQVSINLRRLEKMLLIISITMV